MKTKYCISFILALCMLGIITACSSQSDHASGEVEKKSSSFNIGTDNVPDASSPSRFKQSGPYLGELGHFPL